MRIGEKVGPLLMSKGGRGRGRGGGDANDDDDEKFCGWLLMEVVE